MSFEIGQIAKMTRSFSAADLDEYRALTGDSNPAHAGDDPVLPGMLLGGLISRLLGIELPGRGTNWMKQELTFYAAAKLDEPITASVEIVRLRPDKDLVNLRTRCVVGDRLLCEGEALVMAREMAEPSVSPA